MHSVLLHVEKPAGSTSAEVQAWQSFPGIAASITSQDEAIRMLGESCWLLPLQKSVHSFVALAHAAQVHKLTYHVLFFEAEPPWIDYAPTPSSS